MMSFKSHYHATAGSKGSKHVSVKPASLSDLPDASIATMLRPYLLSSDQMRGLGYPFEFSRYQGYACIRHNPPQYQRANAVSGSGSSGGSSPEDSDLQQDSSASVSNKLSDGGDVPQNAIERRCSRCSKPFYANRDDGEYVSEEKCCYHWGKLRSRGWDCCHGSESARGCSSARVHVWTGLVEGYNGPFRFVCTDPAIHHSPDDYYGVYALDCEMCFTKRGLEVGRVTLVYLNGEVVYEAMVKPEAEVIDFNTRFSGLSAKDFVDAKSLRVVQQELKRFVFAETILVGHGLENDLRALQLLHSNIIDTAVCFPHYKGFPFRNSLKSLALIYLDKEIQQHEHDSAEDARIALGLIYSKLEKQNVGGITQSALNDRGTTHSTLDGRGTTHSSLGGRGITHSALGGRGTTRYALGGHSSAYSTHIDRGTTYFTPHEGGSMYSARLDTYGTTHFERRARGSR